MSASWLRSVWVPILLCSLFFFFYSTLAIVRHMHYESYGYDLGINDQLVWRYATFQKPITTIDPFPDRTKLATHVEFIYAVIAPIYWIWDSVLMLVIFQAFAVCSSALAVYLLARKYKLHPIAQNILVIVYLLFYGVQFGLWTDVHSSVFGAVCVMWFIYFLDARKKWLTLLFFMLSITSKETVGSGVFLILLVCYWYRREKSLLLYALTAMLYMCFIFFIFYPDIMHVHYLYAGENGIFGHLNPWYMVDDAENRMAIFYSFFSWGFVSLLSPLFLIPIVGHFYKFFVLATNITGAQGIFGQYRIGLDPFFAFATIWVLKSKSVRWQIILACWILICSLIIQYLLHLPLSYLSKSWFWTMPKAVSSIEYVRQHDLPSAASVVAQDNILPHIDHRDKVYTLYPEGKTFQKNSPCGENLCNWFRWYGSPQYLLVDTSTEWDIRMWLTNREEFIDGLANLQKAGVIKPYKQVGTTYLYKVIMNPDNYH